MMSSCKTCKHFKRSGVNKSIGQCFRYPPVMNAPRITNDTKHTGIDIVNETMVCGEHAPYFVPFSQRIRT